MPLAVIHLPHASRGIPADLRPTFLLDDAILARELDRMTDHYTDEPFAVPATVAATVRLPVSCFVVDPERFEDDAEGWIAQRGQGVVYILTSPGQPLRRPPTPTEREALLDRFYRPHHAQLDKLVAAALDAHGTVLVIDGHSFPDTPLPMEFRVPIQTAVSVTNRGTLSVPAQASTPRRPSAPPSQPYRAETGSRG